MSNLKLALVLFAVIFGAIGGAQVSQLSFDVKSSEVRLQKTIFQLDNIEYQMNLLRRRLISEQIVINERILQEAPRVLMASVPQTPIKCLTDNIYFESGFEPYEGQLAVAQVTLNRAHERTSDICNVVYFKKVNPNTGKKEAAFSWTLGRKWKPRGINREAYLECAQLAREVLTNHLRSAIIDSSVVMYHANYVAPRWKHNYEMVAQIGAHIFYR